MVAIHKHREVGTAHCFPRCSSSASVRSPHPAAELDGERDPEDLFRLPPVTDHAAHSEEEIRIILDQSQSSGMLSFRRLLHIENVLDMGSLTVRNAMSARRLVRARLPTRDENEKRDRRVPFSRVPAPWSETPEKPLGYVHVKDLFLAERAGNPTDDLRAFVRPCPQLPGAGPLEQRLSEMQRKAAHMALVFSDGGK